MLVFLASLSRFAVEIKQKKKLRWCCARDLFGSQFPVTTGGFKQRIFDRRSSYLTHQAIGPNRLGGFGVPEFATLRQEQLIQVEILQLQAKFRTAQLVLTGLGNYFVCMKFTIQILVWTLEFTIQINLEHDTIAA